MEKLLNRSIFIFSILGLAVSAYLAYEYSLGGSVNCPIGGGGCDIVRISKYSSFFGIDIPYLGIVFYLAVAFLSVLLTQGFKKIINLVRLLISFSGFAFGVYLTFLEAFVIGAYCFWCVTSFIISIIIFALCIIHWRKYAK